MGLPSDTVPAEKLTVFNCTASALPRTNYPLCTTLPSEALPGEDEEEKVHNRNDELKSEEYEKEYQKHPVLLEKAGDGMTALGRGQEGEEYLGTIEGRQGYKIEDAQENIYIDDEREEDDERGERDVAGSDYDAHGDAEGEREREIT